MGVRTNIASIITNILITNIIIQIPEGSYLTCTPPLPPSFLCLASKSPYLSWAHKAKTFSLAHSGWGRLCLAPGARPPFKSASLWGEESRVLTTQPPPLLPLLDSLSISLCLAAALPFFLPMVHPHYLSLCYLHYLSKSCRFCASQGHHSKLLPATV